MKFLEFLKFKNVNFKLINKRLIYFLQNKIFKILIYLINKIYINIYYTKLKERNCSYRREFLLYS